jgi:hypothetical protein
MVRLRRVTVALELPQGMQPQIDAFLAALDHALALAALAGTPLVDPGVVDGRTSQAMFAMLDTLRQLKADGRDIAILAFQPSDPSPPELSQAWYELDMAYWLSRAVVERPQAKVIALVGSIHASKTAVSGLAHIGLPATAHLPPAEVLSLVVANQGGQTWSCRQGCGVHDSPGGHDQDARGIVLEPTADGAFDGTIALGPAHASPPFVTVLTPPVMQGH